MHIEVTKGTFKDEFQLTLETADKFLELQEDLQKTKAMKNKHEVEIKTSKDIVEKSE